MPRDRTYGDGPKCMGCGAPAAWSGYCQMEDGRGFCNARRSVAERPAASEWQTPGDSVAMGLATAGAPGHD